jgi:two-component system, chemotaxis family, CheB/CheR fusion protein
MPTKKSDGVRKKPTASKVKKARKPKSTEQGVPVPEAKVSFPIVGIGASAGGLEAFEQFFTHTPQDTGMAFVLIQHLDPKHKSILSELVQRYTKMTVHEVEDGMVVEPNAVYVIPPNRNMALLHGFLHLLEQSEIPSVRTTIDFFFRSLAEDRKEEAICIVLSGTGTEGAMGLRAVKGEGGLVMVQDPESAKYDGMPRSAIATGLVDYILLPEKMADQLIRYVHHSLDDLSEKTTDTVNKKSGLLQKIFILVRSKTGHDFSYYKQNTILRRIERRMAVNQITRLSDYVRYMQEDPREAVILFKELLIGVTNFFRDKEAFEALRDKAISKLFEDRSPDNPVRIWVSGCTTGEEAYSIAMLCQDFLTTKGKNISFQIFATDIDSEAIETARLGLYPKSIAVDLPPEYVERFFTREESSFRVKKEIRDRMVFALQNVISDPPFSKIDLISCRNLLIYLGSELQKKVLPLFHYSLKKEGFLFLGSSETIGEFSDYFSVVDRKWKLYKRKDTGIAQDKAFDLHSPTVTDRRVDAQVARHGAPMRGTNYREVAEKTILKSYGPTGVVINEKSEVLYIHGRAGKYLEPPSGEFTGNILAMAREGLKLELATALRKVVTQKTEIRTEHVRVKTNGEDQLINLVVKPISQPESLKGTVMVIFEEARSEDRSDEQPKSPVGIDNEPDPRVQQLEQELRSTKEYLQTTIEELETTNEELKSTNEELQSSNEELQSTNEELETSKEELQSINEELTTVNFELQQKIEELSRTGSDLNNLLASTEIGTIFLDRSLNIRSFTPAATEFLSLLQTDIGRPVTHLATNMSYDRLAEDSKDVLKKLAPKEMEVQTKGGRWFAMRILPYRTIENVIDGVVITFVEMTQRREIEEKLRQEMVERERAQQQTQRALDYAESIVNTVREPLVVLDGDLRIVSANRSFYQTLQVTPEETQGSLLYDLGNRQWDIPRLRELLEEILPNKTEVIDYEMDHVFPEIGLKTMVLNARQMANNEGGEEKKLILLVIEDRTGLPQDRKA